MIASFIIKSTKSQSRWTVGKVGTASNSGSVANLLHDPEQLACLALSSVSFSIILCLVVFICKVRWLGQTTLDFCSNKSTDAQLIH